jgi:hypothetical protein
VIAAVHVHADDGVGADLERLLAQSLKRSSPGQIPRVGQRVQLAQTSVCRRYWRTWDGDASP